MRPRQIAALAVAAGADVVQFALAPLFGEGFASPFDDVLDIAVGCVLVWLLGFHWALLPAAGAELIPGLDLAPTWTASVLLIVAPGKAKLWIAGAAILLLAAVAYAVYRGTR
ncbi:MAG TPA: hypothetical protein VGH20_04485 [Myxococcales bacterium]